MAIDAVIADLLELIPRHTDPPAFGNGIGHCEVTVDRLARLDTDGILPLFTSLVAQANAELMPRTRIHCV